MHSPLTYGQLSVIRALQRLPTQTWPQTYLATVVQLADRHAVPDVSAAIEALAQRHETLRTHFVEGPEGFESVTMPAGRVDLDIVELPGRDETTAESVARARSATRFCWDAEFAWRATILTDGGLATRVAIEVDHLAADGWGLNRLAAELRAMLGEPDENGAGWINQTPPQPRDLAAAQRSESWQARRDAADQYWERLLREQAPECFPWATAQDDSGRIEAILHSPRARFFLGRAAHQLGASPQSVLLALTAVAAATAFDLDGIVLTLQASNRSNRRWRDIVTSMNQATPLPVAMPGATTSFAEFAKQVLSASINAYRNGCYDIDHMRTKVREARGVDLSFDCYFNFMAQDVVPHTATPSTELAPSLCSPTRPRRQAGPRFDVKVRGGPDMPLLIRADPGLLDEHKLRHLLEWFEDEITRLGSGERVAVADVRSRCARW